MLMAERQSRMQELLARRGMANLDAIASELDVSQSTVGRVSRRYGVLLGPMSESSLATIHTQTLFLSVAGVHDGTLYNQNLLLVQAERRMMEQAQQVVLLVDSSKFGQQALVSLCKLEEIDVVVTDAGLSPVHREQLQAAACQMIIAQT